MKYILVVDDSKTITRTLEELIQNELNIKTLIASSKAEAQELLVRYKGEIQVALLDLGLPDAPNGEVVDSVTKFHIPSIVLTGSDDKEHIFRNKNIVDYVIKEGRFTFEYILRLLRRIIKNNCVKVIVAEDSNVIAKHIIDLINRYQLTCYHATDGKSALELLEEHPDVKMVFTDYDMPKLDGLSLTKEIRKRYSKDELSIITITGSNDGSIVSKFLKYGANDFLYKGFSDEEFYARLNSNLETLDLFETIKDKANKDFMTGMYNRRFFFDDGSNLYEYAKQNNHNICVAIFDIDKFKSINDTYGHDIGDIAIKEVANVVDKYFDDNAIISRFGGEEFCVIQTNIGENEFVDTLETIRKEFEINVIDTPKGDIKYTVSIGYTTNYGDVLDDMVNEADVGLYEAKNNGRNQVRRAN
jgi:diguanylate cyclase (GGDEF)-like protein